MPTETLRAEPDSSTHVGSGKKKRGKRRHKERRKHGSKKKKRIEKSPTSTDSKDASEESDAVLSDIGENSEEERDLEKQAIKFDFDIMPLEHYLPDIKALYKEIFSIINKKEFKKMLPENLKKYEAKEVRKWCLEEMEGISIKRLRAILCGNAMTSSSSESEGAESDTEKTQSMQMDCSGPNKAVETGEKTGSHRCELSEHVVQDFSILAELSKSPNETEIDELLEGDLQAAESKHGGDPKTDAGDQLNVNTIKYESKAEIRELELRARALQSFLKFQEKKQLGPLKGNAASISQ